MTARRPAVKKGVSILAQHQTGTLYALVGITLLLIEKRVITRDEVLGMLTPDGDEGLDDATGQVIRLFRDAVAGRIRPDGIKSPILTLLQGGKSDVSA
jgi:hypothetical protein